jgi:ribonuclease HI
MYFDGSLKLGGSGAGVVFISPRGEQLKCVFQILFEVSNNEAEYEALLHGLCLAVSLGIKRLLAYGDSLLVVQKVNKEWDINKDIMDVYVMEIRKLKKKFSGLEIHHVVRTTMWARMCSPNLVLIELMYHREFSFTSCITLPSGHQTQVPSLQVPRNLIERS